MNKAQYVTVDLLIGLGIFLVILLTAFWSYRTVEIQQSAELDSIIMESAMHRAFHTLVYTSGYPATWHTGNITSDVKAIGLRSGDYVIWRHLYDNNESYSQIKQIMGLSAYDVEIEFYNASSLSSLYFGKQPQGDTVMVREYLVGTEYDQTGRLIMKVWK